VKRSRENMDIGRAGFPQTPEYQAYLWRMNTKLINRVARLRKAGDNPMGLPLQVWRDAALQHGIDWREKDKR